MPPAAIDQTGYQVARGPRGSAAAGHRTPGHRAAGPPGHRRAEHSRQRIPVAPSAHSRGGGVAEYGQPDGRTSTGTGPYRIRRLRQPRNPPPQHPALIDQHRRQHAHQRLQRAKSISLPAPIGRYTWRYAFALGCGRVPGAAADTRRSPIQVRRKGLCWPPDSHADGTATRAVPGPRFVAAVR